MRKLRRKLKRLYAIADDEGIPLENVRDGDRAPIFCVWTTRAALRDMRRRIGCPYKKIAVLETEDREAVYAMLAASNPGTTVVVNLHWVPSEDRFMAEHTVSAIVIAIPIGGPHREREIPKEQLN